MSNSEIKTRNTLIVNFEKIIETKQNPFELVPDEIIIHMLSFIPKEFIVSAARTCKRFADMMPDWWAQLAFKDFKHPVKEFNDAIEIKAKGRQEVFTKRKSFKAPDFNFTLLNSLFNVFEEMKHPLKIELAGNQIKTGSCSDLRHEYVEEITSLSKGYQNIMRELSEMQMTMTCISQISEKHFSTQLKGWELFPRDLYHQIWKENQPVMTCQYTFTRGMNKGSRCGKLTVKGTPLCSFCSNKKAARLQQMASVPQGPTVNVTHQQPIRVIPFDTGLYKDEKHGFILKLETNNIIMVMGIVRSGSDQVQSLTPDERSIASSLGLHMAD